MVNSKAKIIIEAVFDTIIKKDFEDYFLVNSKNKFGAYSTKGETIFDCKYEKIIMPCGSNKLSLGKLNRKWVVTNNNGQLISNNSYDTIITNCYWGNSQFIQVKQNNKFGILDTSGKIIYQLIYDDFIFRDSFLIYKLNGVYGVKNLKTNADVIKAEWDLIHFRNNHYFIIKRKDKFGVFFPTEHKNKRQYFPLADTDDIEVVQLSSLKEKDDFILFGIYQDNKYFYLGENDIRFTNH